MLRNDPTTLHDTIERHFAIRFRKKATIRLRQILRYDSDQFRDTTQGDLALRFNPAFSTCESNKLYDTTPPNCTIRFGVISRYDSNKFHDTTQQNLQHNSAKVHDATQPHLTQISRYESAKFHDTTQGKFTIRTKQISRYDAAKFYFTTQPNCTRRLRPISRYDSANFAPPNSTILLIDNFTRRFHQTFTIRPSETSRYDPATKIHDMTYTVAKNTRYDMTKFETKFHGAALPTSTVRLSKIL